MNKFIKAGACRSIRLMLYGQAAGKPAIQLSMSPCKMSKETSYASCKPCGPPTSRSILSTERSTLFQEAPYMLAPEGC